MANSSDNVGGMQSASELKERSKKGLREFFQDRRIKNLVSVLVPGALAAALFPVFGPVVAGAAAVVAVKNGLQLLGISFSDDTIKKIVKPLEGQQLDENDMQDVLQETLQELLPTDKDVNDEAAKALVTVAPEVKEAALTNPKLDQEWLGESLESSLREQGESMAKVAPHVHNLILLDETGLQSARDQLLANWSLVTQEVTAIGSSEVSNIEQGVEGSGAEIKQRVAAEDHSKITGVKQSVRQPEQPKKPTQ